MLVTKDYNRENAREYARRWAFSRNPLYYDYAGIGGNCTNFVSQAVYAGSCTMNYTPVYGWYYLSAGERTAAWTGVNYFYNFMVGNRDVGPFAEESTADGVTVGDVVQLGRAAGGYYHTLLVVGRAGDDILVAANSDDAYERPLSTYTYDFARFLHILGVRLRIPDTLDCFQSVLNGIAILPNFASTPPLVPGAGGTQPDGEAPDGTAPDGSVPDGTGPDGMLPEEDAPAPAEEMPGGGAAEPTPDGGGAPLPEEAAPIEELPSPAQDAPPSGGDVPTLSTAGENVTPRTGGGRATPGPSTAGDRALGGGRATPGGREKPPAPPYNPRVYRGA